MSFSTNPFNKYHAPDSKEFIELNKQATINFKATKLHDIKPANANEFCRQILANAKTFGYSGTISRVPTTRTVDDADPTIITFGGYQNIIETWNQFTRELIHKTANVTWGDKTWTVTGDKQIIRLSQARGEVNAGVRGDLNETGKLMLMRRWKATILAHQLLESLTPKARLAIEVHKNQFEWYDELSGETNYDGLTIAHLILEKLRSNAKINIFNELAKVKKIKPADYQFDITEWESNMEAGRNLVELKCPGAYHEDQYILDLFHGASTTPCKTYSSQIETMKQNWLLGISGTESWTKDTISAQLVQIYTNMTQDGTWQRELSETNQIIALTTQIREMEKRFEQTTNAFATATEEATKRPANQRGPYTVAPWRLEHKGETIKHNGSDWHWCKGDHWSNMVKHNGMYCTHNTTGHDAWRKQHDEKKASAENTREPNRTPASNPTVDPGTSDKPKSDEAQQKKLALRDKLRTALTSHAGLSSEAYNRIWEEANRDPERNF